MELSPGQEMPYCQHPETLHISVDWECYGLFHQLKLNPKTLRMQGVAGSLTQSLLSPRTQMLCISSAIMKRAEAITWSTWMATGCWIFILRSPLSPLVRAEKSVLEHNFLSLHYGSPDFRCPIQQTHACMLPDTSLKGREKEPVIHRG